MNIIGAQPSVTKRASGAQRRPAQPGLAKTLPGTALRLLSALAELGLDAIPDPTDPDRLILRGRRGSVSLGRGSYPRDAATLLIDADLAEAKKAGASYRVTITEVGQAHLRRRQTREDAPFRAQHQETLPVEITDAAGTQRVMVNAAESPLDWLFRRRDAENRPLIDATEHEAGERLRRDVTQAGLLPSVTARWDGAIGGSGGAARDVAGATDMVIAARQRVHAALDAVGGDFADLLLDLCGFLKGLEQIERERQWPARSAKIVVRMALRRLADHYGLGSAARGPARSRGIRAWNAAGGDPPQPEG